jgi:enediyne biosynthesis protein E4
MKRTTIGQLACLCLLIVLLCVPAMVKRLSASAPGTHDPNAIASARARYGFALRDVAAEAGIHFVHEAPHQLDPKLAHIMPQIASMGAAVSVVDFDRDGWPDLYVINSGEGSKNHLYRNLHDGTFKDVAEELGIADLNQPGTGVCMGAVWADYDNDGDEDLLVYKWGRPELFHNDKGKGFTRVTDTANLPKWVNANSAIWLDYDNDGKVDLLITGYWPDDVDLWHLKSTKIMCESFEYANNGGGKYLLHNNGNGTFTDVTAQMGIRSKRWTLAAAAANLRGTGYPDIFLANDYGVSELYANAAGKGFREIGESAGLGSRKSGMSASFGDVTNQGRFAIYKTNISEHGVLIQGNDLWLPEGDTSGDGTPRYSDSAVAMGVSDGGWSWGAQFGDLNNDGWLDLFCTNGYVSADRNGDYWYDFSKIAGANTRIISDAVNWPPMKGRSLSGYQQKKLWLNDGAGRFTEVSQAVGASDTFDGRAVVLVDLWNRGALDLVVANQKAPLKLYKNDVDGKNAWITFELEGTRSNRSAIGAQVRIFWNGMEQVQEVSGGSGFAAQNDRRLHFGLGRSAKVDRVEIRWPSGRKQIIAAPATNQIHHVKEQE